MYVLSLYMNAAHCLFIVFMRAYQRDRQTDKNGKSFKKKLPNSILHTQTDIYRGNVT
jgi:hypothetical protein